MTKLLKMIAVGIFSSMAPSVFADTAPSMSPFHQVIQVVNMLSNSVLTNPGMTPTSVTVAFTDSVTTRVCWSTILSYQGDFTLRTGPKQGCLNPVSQVTITPITVSGVLNTYSGPLVVPIDQTKYATQLTIVQDVAPIFDAASGLVSTPGTMQVNQQSQYRG
jgi:hypothetical protein